MTVNVRDFGCVGDGITDDRAAFQSALDAGAGATVVVPVGRYLLGRGAGYFCVNVPAGTTVAGDPGAVLVQGIVGGSVRLIQCAAPSIALVNLELDGQRSLQVADEHRAGVFALGAVDLEMVNVVAHAFTGDGFTIHTGTDRLMMSTCHALRNGRSGLCFTGDTRTALVQSCRMTGNRVKQVHTEPGAGTHVDGVSLVDCTLDPAGASSDYALSIAGAGGSSPTLSSGWNVTGCEILGSVYMAGASAARFDRTNIYGMTNIYRNSSDILLLDCFLTTRTNPSVVEITGTDALNIPDLIALQGCTIVTSSVAAMGVHITSGRRVTIDGCALAGGGVLSPYAYGIYARSIVPGSDLAVSVTRNTVYDFGSTGFKATDTGGSIIWVSAMDNEFSGISPRALDIPASPIGTQSGNTATAPMVLGV